jgi:hypothetical protein
VHIADGRREMRDLSSRMNATAARPIVALVFAILLSHRAAAQTDDRDTVAHRPRVDSIYRPEPVRDYLFGTFGPRPIIRGLALAGFDQLRGRRMSSTSSASSNSYPETWRGFEDRLGTRFAQVAISRTIRFGLSRAVDQRTIRYVPCTCGDTSSRLAYALISPYRVSSPTGIRLSLLNPVSELVSGILVTSVRPGGFRVGEGVRNGITGLAAESVGGLVREYWPWHWRPPFL